MRNLTEKECLEALRSLRWEGEIRCVSCNSEKVLKYGKDRKGFPRYICKECKKSFNDKTDTIFDGSQISIQEWFEILHDYKKKSLRKISLGMGKPYNTIHACAKKLKEDGLASKIRDFLDERKRTNKIFSEIHRHSPVFHVPVQIHEKTEYRPPARKPRILMLGWEFYPKKVGGLGKVCYELAMALKSKGAELTIILPIEVEHEGLNIISTNFDTRPIRSLLSPYLTAKAYQSLLMGRHEHDLYGMDMFKEVERFAMKCLEIAKTLDFDLIHAHDWMTYKAGLAIKAVTGKPLVLHVHATEFDRGCGLGVNQDVYDIEKKAFQEADMVIAVSNFTKEKIARNYGIDESKIKVLHNALDCNEYRLRNLFENHGKSKTVLYFGRITMQKGPDYFIRAAKKVLEQDRDVIFIMAGTGDMLSKMIDLSCDLGISDRVLFTGYLSEEDAKNIYRMADIYIMPSVSEPFGVTALEAAASGVPLIISKSSGVSEVMKNCLSVDFWDIDEMANKIVSCLKYDSLSGCISENGLNEVKKLDWGKQAEKCIGLYDSLMG
jgi:glycogen(starch) synthase